MVTFKQPKAFRAVDSALSEWLSSLVRWLPILRQKAHNLLRNSAMNNCEQTRQWLDAYLDNELDPVNTLKIEQHLLACAACLQAYEEQRALGQVTRAVPRYPAPAGLRERILSALRAESDPLTSIHSC